MFMEKNAIFLIRLNKSPAFKDSLTNLKKIELA